MGKIKETTQAKEEWVCGLLSLDFRLVRRDLLGAERENLVIGQELGIQIMEILLFFS